MDYRRLTKQKKFLIWDLCILAMSFDDEALEQLVNILEIEIDVSTAGPLYAILADVRESFTPVEESENSKRSVMMELPKNLVSEGKCK